MFEKNVVLANLVSYRIGGPSRYFFDARNKQQIKDAITQAKGNKLPIFILGSGTNLLVSDRGFKGLVLRPNVKTLKMNGNEIAVGAGVLMSDLLNFAVKKSLSGLEWAGGLPGTVGGAIRGNAGAFGGEMKDSVKSVRSINAQTLKETERTDKECEFGYRSSIFKELNGKEIIVEAVLRLKLKKGSSKKIKKEIEEKIAYRKERHPVEYPNIGSIFKNVPLEKMPSKYRREIRNAVKIDPFPVVPAAYLISESGLKGVSCGGAMVSPKHPNFIVNSLGATASDVKKLIQLVKKRVKGKYKINLEEEIQII